MGSSTSGNTSSGKRTKAQIDDELSMGWGRASILLNLGDMVEATKVALQTLDLDPKMRAMAPLSGIAFRQLTAHRQFPERWSLYVPERGFVVVAYRVWDELIMDPAIHAHASKIGRYKQTTWVPLDIEALRANDEDGTIHFEQHGHDNDL